MSNFGIEVMNSSQQLVASSNHEMYVCVLSAVVGTGHHVITNMLPEDIVATTNLDRGADRGASRNGGHIRCFGTQRVTVFRRSGAVSGILGFGLQVFSSGGALTFSSNHYPMIQASATTTYYASSQPLSVVFTAWSGYMDIGMYIIYQLTGVYSNGERYSFAVRGGATGNQVPRARGVRLINPLLLDISDIPLTYSIEGVSMQIDNSPPHPFG